jgi:hypothetical protein
MDLSFQLDVDTKDARELLAQGRRVVEIEKALIRWQVRVSEYLSLGEKETDPIGKKFYESYALGVGNCIAEVTDILGGRGPNAV